MGFKIFPRDFLIKILFVVMISTTGVIGLTLEALAEPRDKKIQGALSFTLNSGKIFQFFPRGNLYEPYIADPHQPRFGALIGGATDNDIARADDYRIILKAGGLFGLFRIHPDSQPNLGLQLSFEAGMDAQFDLNNSQDNLGWDGNLGWFLAAAMPEGWSYKFGLLHTSSHLGDEFILNTGRQRIGYTRREALWAISKHLHNLFRTYTEVGVGYNPGNRQLQDPLRVQGGLEFKYPIKRFDFFTAFDVSTMEEREWKFDFTVQGGLSLPIQERRYRVGMEFHKGRPTLGEYFQSTETLISLGLWVDI